MPDVFTPTKRSEVMTRIRSRGNRDTELALMRLLRRHGITGWRRHREIRCPQSSPRPLQVRPDFVFLRQRLAVFVDGCFWHGCPIHSPPARWLQKSAMPDTAAPARGRGTARTGKRFWEAKLAANRARDRRVNRLLREAGWRVLRLWEHELQAATPRARMRRSGSSRSGPTPPRDRWGERRLVARLRRALAAADQPRPLRRLLAVP